MQSRLTVWMKYCGNESCSKVLARFGKWIIRHGQYLKRDRLWTSKGKKPSGWKIRNKLATIITNRSSGCEHNRRYPRTARISGKRSRSAWMKEAELTVRRESERHQGRSRRGNRKDLDGPTDQRVMQSPQIGSTQCRGLRGVLFRPKPIRTISGVFGIN